MLMEFILLINIKMPTIVAFIHFLMNAISIHMEKSKEALFILTNYFENSKFLSPRDTGFLWHIFQSISQLKPK